jgi:hypothetical protein
MAVNSKHASGYLNLHKDLKCDYFFEVMLQKGLHMLHDFHKFLEL